ncbi:MAG: hypothetical protein ACKVQK_12825 [Burkholderiales bacterium]
MLLLLMRQFQIESAAFLRLAALAFGGFAVYALLPLRFRLPCFVVLSLAGTCIVLGYQNAAWLLALGGLLIGICHIPVSFVLRGLLLVTVGVVLAAQRANVVPFPWSDAIWPVLGSMFMFRLLVYFYDIRHEKVPGTPMQAVAYFFMLPNVCFPLFPVVDYKAFRRAFFDDDAYRTYQVGIDWMVRGIIHLILYRIVYYYLVLAPNEVVGPAEFVQYMVANFMLYLRVSGLFHLIVGMLYLFGFRMPETHNRYLLAASFTDFWRRINIYWKDFMQKVFYYPAVFKLKKFGTTWALVIATLYVFFMTWFLHAYQWFWLRGSVLFVAQDILFWTILGVLVVLNSLYEIKHGRVRTLAKTQRTPMQFTLSALKTYATFWFICVLWSFWTAESPSQWASLWEALGGRYTWHVLIWPLIVLAVIVIGIIPSGTLRNTKLSGQSDGDWARTRALTVIALFALIGVSIERVAVTLGPEAGTFIHSLRSGKLSRIDVAKMEQGYYQNLLSVDRFNSQLWEVYTNKPATWLDTEFANLKYFSDGFVQTELKPSFSSVTRHGTITINRWGMRDRDYEKARAPDTFRAVILGPSTVMGWGVDDAGTFEALIETRLNQELPVVGIRRYEILNFGVPGYQPPQQVPNYEKSLKFSPDALIYVATGRELSRATSYLAEVLGKNIDIPYPELQAIVDEAGLRPGMNEIQIEKGLAPMKERILAFTYQQIARMSRSNGVVPIWVFLPQARDGTWKEETPDSIRIAQDSGFTTIDLSNVYDGNPLADVQLAQWDTHPNARGHQVVAERLYAELMSRRETVFQTKSIVPAKN